MRVRSLLAALVVPLIALTVAGPAQAAPASLTYLPSGWSDVTYTINTYYLTIGGQDAVKIVVALQYYSPVDGGTLGDVTAARTRCAIRNLNDTLVSGVKVNECAFGVYGGATLTASGEALDGGTCCANQVSPFRYVDYSYPAGIQFVGRATVSYRVRSSGDLVTTSRYSARSDCCWQLV